MVRKKIPERHEIGENSASSEGFNLRDIVSAMPLIHILRFVSLNQIRASQRYEYQLPTEASWRGLKTEAYRHNTGIWIYSRII